MPFEELNRPTLLSGYFQLKEFNFIASVIVHWRRVLKSFIALPTPNSQAGNTVFFVIARSCLLYLDVLETVDTSDTVSDAEDTASLFEVGGGGGPEDPVLQDGADLTGNGLDTSILKETELLSSFQQRCTVYWYINSYRNTLRFSILFKVATRILLFHILWEQNIAIKY